MAHPFDLFRFTPLPMRELAESIHEAFWITNTENTKVFYVSPAYERIFQRSCAEIAVLEKPFRGHALAERVRHVLDGRPGGR